MPAPEVGEVDDDGVVPDAALAVREAADEVWLAEAAELDDIIDEDMEDAIEETDDMADEALLETEDAAEEAAEPEERTLVDAGVDWPLVAEPEEARPDEPETFRQLLEPPSATEIGAVEAVVPVESVTVRVMERPASMLTSQVNWLSDVGCESSVAIGLALSWPPGRTRT